MRQTARNVKGLTPGRGKAMFLGGVETRKAARRLGAGAVEGRRVRVGVSNKKRAGTRLRSGPPLAMATFSAYTQPGPPSKDDGGRMADGEAEHAAWKTSDDYRKKGIYVILCLLLGKKANNFCVSPFCGDTRMPLSESQLIVFTLFPAHVFQAIPH